MIRSRRSARLLAGCLLSVLAPFAFSTCGGSDYAGGGTGGTGVSTGVITGFGSVVVNGVHFRTDENVAPGFVTKKIFKGTDMSSRKDRDLLREGMVLIVLHTSGGSDATEIEYRDNLEGPIASKSTGADNVLSVLGQSVVLDNGALFDFLAPGNVVEVSGFVDAGGRIRATYVQLQRLSPRTNDHFELKGFVSGLSLPGNAFRLGSLPDGSGTTVTVSYDGSAISALPGGPENGMHVQVVTTDAEPVSGILTAARIERLVPRTEFPEGSAVELEGLVTTPPSGSGSVWTFAVEGKRVQTDANTQFAGGTQPDIDRDVRLQVQGTESGGVLSAARIIFR